MGDDTGDAGTIGIDAGATLCKLARVDGALETARFASTDVAAVRACVAGWRPARIGATGGGAAALGAAIGGVPLRHIGEFDAWARGSVVVARHEGVALPSRCLIVSLGTGTSVLAVEGPRVERVGGTAVGGGTVLGLGRLLLGAGSFDELTALAGRGDRRRVDLLVGDVYPAAAEAPLLRDLSAANFAKLDSTDPADLANALMGLVGETVALIASSHARRLGIETIVYCGSTLHENRALHAVVADITERFGHRPCFLRLGAHCGAVGAAVLAAG